MYTVTSSRGVILQAVAFIPLCYGVVLFTRVVLLGHPFAWLGVDQILTPILISLAAAVGGWYRLRRSRARR